MKLTEALPPVRGKLLRDEPLGPFTWFRVGGNADAVFVADVYAAGETPIEGVDKHALVEGVRRFGHRSVQPLESVEALPGVIAAEAKDGDLVVLLGAGDITQWAYALPGQLEGLA
jgi:UDP-N-acetylmuramate--alanine ligase